MIRIMCLLVSFLLRNAEADVDYCSVCDPPKKHTMCLYPKAGAGEKCVEYSRVEMDAATRERLVHAHNRWRNVVALGRASNEMGRQPAAAAMLQLQWSPELARLAQRWADQCVPFHAPQQHDACRRIPGAEVGQNIFASATQRRKPFDLVRAVDSWYKEMEHYDPEWVASFVGSQRAVKEKVGHYTQLVWGATQQVGCAAVAFVDRSAPPRPWFVQRVVCNYAPAGNVMGAQVYREGAPCSACPNGTACNRRYGGLCAPDQVRDLPLPEPVEDDTPAEWVRKAYRPRITPATRPPHAFPAAATPTRHQRQDGDASASTTTTTTTPPPPTPPPHAEQCEEAGNHFEPPGGAVARPRGKRGRWRTPICLCPDED